MAESWHTTSMESTAVVMKALTHLDIVTLNISLTRDTYQFATLSLAKEFVLVGYLPQRITSLQKPLTVCTQSRPYLHTGYLLLAGQLFQG